MIVFFLNLSSNDLVDIDVIVIDHHIPDIKLPPAYAINPKELTLKKDMKIYAAGVTFIFLVGLNRELRKQGFKNKLT